MKKIVLFMVLGLALSACTTMKSFKKYKKTSLAEQALERQNQRR